MTTISEGDRVRCRSGNIDNGLGLGLIGTAEGFARFSKYHGREVYVRFGPRLGEGEPHPADGWFWVANVEPAT